MTNAVQANAYRGNYDGIDAKTISRVMACPFCGTKPEIMPSGERGRDLMHRNDNVWSMCCYSCGAQVPNRYGEHGLNLMREQWNKRAALTAAQ